MIPEPLTRPCTTPHAVTPTAKLDQAHGCRMRRAATATCRECGNSLLFGRLCGRFLSFFLLFNLAPCSSFWFLLIFSVSDFQNQLLALLQLVNIGDERYGTIPCGIPTGYSRVNANIRQLKVTDFTSKTRQPITCFGFASLFL